MITRQICEESISLDVLISSMVHTHTPHTYNVNTYCVYIIVYHNPHVSHIPQLSLKQQQQRTTPTEQMFRENRVVSQTKALCRTCVCVCVFPWVVRFVYALTCPNKPHSAACQTPTPNPIHAHTSARINAQEKYASIIYKMCIPQRQQAAAAKRRERNDGRDKQQPQLCVCVPCGGARAIAML